MNIELGNVFVLYILGVTGKMSTDSAHEDDNFGTESSQKALLDKLGAATRDRILASLYIGR